MLTDPSHQFYVTNKLCYKILHLQTENFVNSFRKLNPKYRLAQFNCLFVKNLYENVNNLPKQFPKFIKISFERVFVFKRIYDEKNFGYQLK